MSSWTSSCSSLDVSVILSSFNYTTSFTFILLLTATTFVTSNSRLSIFLTISILLFHLCVHSELRRRRKKRWADFHTFACLFYSAKWDYEPYWSIQWQGIIGSLKKIPHFERRIREVVNHFIKTARTDWLDISLEMLDGGFPLSAE